MKKVIIAEKPKLASKIAAAIPETFRREDGYFESDSYIVTWAFGHLFTLIDVEQYDPEYDPHEKYPWELDNLPFYPSKFRFMLKSDSDSKYGKGGVKKQFKTICKLIARKDVDAVINAGDSDREGEIIVRIILAHAQNKKPVLRLWLPNQTIEKVQEQLACATPDSDYDNLANEGMARTFIDWLYGINLTRYATLKSGQLLRVGRVISEIVNAIYERDMAIKNFVPEKYFAISSKEETNGEIVELTSKKFEKTDDISVANDWCSKYNSVPAIVKDVKKERKTISPGKLYSLSKLEGVLGKKHKMSVQETLDTVQELYEAGYVTYPRTNTEYLATAEKDTVKKVINALKGDFPVAFRDSKSIFDDSKIESHSALTPTTKIPPEGSLTKKEQLVYDTIRDRFVAVFCAEPCEVDRSTIVISVGEYEDFTLTGDIMVKKGWTEFDTYTKKDKALPALSIGDRVNTDFKPVEKQTEPPSHFTIDSLNKYLINPFKTEKEEAKENDDEEYAAILNGLEIGTEATRPAIITNAINANYIQLKKDTYTITPLGVFYAEALRELNISMNKSKTVEISKALKSVYKGEMSITQSLAIAKNAINKVFETKDIVIKSSSADVGIVGTCPVCGRGVKKQKWGYGCSGYKDGCKFAISTIAGKKLSESQVKMLLEKGETSIIKGFTGKSGNKFDAKLKIEDGKVVFAFNKAPELTLDELYCPRCEKPLTSGKWSVACPDCGFKVNYQIAGKTLSNKDISKLITDGKTDKISGFTSKSGKKFEAKLILTDSHEVKFEF